MKGLKSLAMLLALAFCHSVRTGGATGSPLLPKLCRFPERCSPCDLRCRQLYILRIFLISVGFLSNTSWQT